MNRGCKQWRPPAPNTHHKSRPGKHFGDNFLSTCEGEYVEEIVMYNASGHKKATWTWIREIEEVSMFENQNSEIILSNIDNSTFAYFRTLVSTDYYACNITQLKITTNFLVPSCTSTAKHPISLHPDSDQARPIWYKFARK